MGGVSGTGKPGQTRPLKGVTPLCRSGVKIIKPQAGRSGLAKQAGRQTMLTRVKPLAELPEPSAEPEELPRPHRPPPGAARLPLEPENTPRTLSGAPVGADSPEARISPPGTPAKTELPEAPAPVEKVSPPEPAAEVKRPESLPAASAGAEKPEAPPEPPEETGIPPVENGSVYFLPYRYYLSSEEKVFSGTDGWNPRLRYQEFLTAMRGKISGSGFDEKEAAVVCQIFEKDMELMFYEKAIQEIGERGFGLTQAEQERCISTYRKQLWKEKQDLRAREMAAPPSGFNASALWFASFSNVDAPCLPSSGEHAGSIYFDGGRIRLMHGHGPMVDKTILIRTMGREIMLEKPRNAAEKKALDCKVQERKDKKKDVTLIEVTFGGAGLQDAHISRGWPKTVELIDEDIAQIYYLADRITRAQSGEEYRRLAEQGALKAHVMSAGNKLMAEFIRGHARLKAALGY